MSLSIVRDLITGSYKMDDKTLKALEILASKLGTTSDFLWAVLVKQAVLSALSGLVGVALSIFFSRSDCCSDPERQRKRAKRA